MEKQPYRRRRPALSCVECRRRKIKCDRNYPCANCITAKVQCKYTDKPGTHVAVEEAPSTSSLSFLPSDTVTSTAPARVVLQDDPSLSSGSFTERQSNRPSISKVGAGGMRTTNGIQTGEPDSSNTSRQNPGASFRNHTTNLSKTDEDLLLLHSQPKDGQISLSKKRVLRWNNWRGATQEFETIFAIFTKYSSRNNENSTRDHSHAANAISIRELLAKCKAIASLIKADRPTRSLSFPDFGLTPPSRTIANELANLYFDSFESAHRILHIPTFWSEYDQYWVDPAQAPTNLSLKILLVIAIASSLRESKEEDVELRRMCHNWVYAAQFWLSGPLEKDRLDISGLQIHCLTILARQVLSIGGDLIWMSTGSLVHEAIQIRLHRDPEHLGVTSTLQAEVRRRLWATILELVVQSALDSATPPRISYDEFDTRPPGNIDDEEMDESSTDIQPHPEGTFTSVSMQLMLLESLPIRLQAVQLLNGLRPTLSYLDILAVSSEITSACRACGDFMERYKASGVTTFHRNLLDYLLRRFLLHLNLPFATQAHKNQLFSQSLKICLEAAMALMSPEPDESFSNLMANGGGLIKEGFRYSCVVICLELLVQVDSQRRDGTLHRMSIYRDTLKQAVKDLISFSLRRVKHGETNVKNYLFLAIVLAQVEAIESSVPSEPKIAQSVKEGLELCYDLLCAQLSNAVLPGTGFADFSAFPDASEGYSPDLDLDFLFQDIGFTAN